MKQDAEQYRRKKNRLILLWCVAYVLLGVLCTWNQITRIMAPGSELLSEGLELLVLCAFCLCVSFPILKRVHWYASQTEAKWTRKISKLLMIHHVVFVAFAAVYFLRSLIG